VANHLFSCLGWMRRPGVEPSLRPSEKGGKGGGLILKEGERRKKTPPQMQSSVAPDAMGGIDAWMSIGNFSDVLQKSRGK